MDIDKRQYPMIGIGMVIIVFMIVMIIISSKNCAKGAQVTRNPFAGDHDQKKDRKNFFKVDGGLENDALECTEYSNYSHDNCSKLCNNVGPNCTVYSYDQNKKKCKICSQSADWDQIKTEYSIYLRHGHNRFIKSDISLVHPDDSFGDIESLKECIDLATEKDRCYALGYNAENNTCYVFKTEKGSMNTFIKH